MVSIKDMNRGRAIDFVFRFLPSGINESPSRIEYNSPDRGGLTYHTCDTSNTCGKKLRPLEDDHVPYFGISFIVKDDAPARNRTVVYPISERWVRNRRIGRGRLRREEIVMSDKVGVTKREANAEIERLLKRKEQIRIEMRTRAWEPFHCDTRTDRRPT